MLGWLRKKVGSIHGKTVQMKHINLFRVWQEVEGVDIVRIADGCFMSSIVKMEKNGCVF